MEGPAPTGRWALEPRTTRYTTLLLPVRPPRIAGEVIQRGSNEIRSILVSTDERSVPHPQAAEKVDKSLPTEGTDVPPRRIAVSTGMAREASDPRILLERHANKHVS